MLQSGTILYNSKSHKIEVQSSDSKYFNAIVERISYVSFNNGTQREKQVFHDKESFSIKQIGIHLFYSKTDITKDYKVLASHPKYSFNMTEIIKHHENKHRELLNSIIAEAPDRPTTPDELNSVISTYFDSSHQHEEEITFYKNISKKISYFGRMDFSTVYYKAQYEKLFKGTYYDKIYISKEGSLDIGNTKVIDWRSPIGDFYYNNEDTSFTHGDTYEYKLLLKRSFQFSPLKFHNLYIDGMNLYDEGSVDEFLLKLLHEKRSLHKPTDIIQSIQSNQNKIIRSAPKSNMIVQGCAGSGKTMILLHRLSYMIYNNHISKPTNVAIITPSETFNLFYSDLAAYLELEEVSTSTLDFFYNNLIEQYEVDHFIKTNNKLSSATKTEITDLINDIISSYSLALSYNDEAIRNVHQSYDKIIESLIPNDTLTSLNQIAVRFDIEVPKYSTLTNHDKLKSIGSLCKTTIPFKNEQTEKQCSTIMRKSKSLREHIESLHNQLKVCDSFIEKIHNTTNQSQMIELNKKLTRYFDSITRDQNILANIPPLKTNIINTNEHYTNIISKLNDKIKKEESELTKLETLYDSTTRFNIFKRSNIRRQSEEIQLQLDSFINELNNTEKNHRDKISDFYASLSSLMDNSNHVLIDQSLSSLQKLERNVQNSMQNTKEKKDKILNENELLKILSNTELYQQYIAPLPVLTKEFANSFTHNNNETISTNLKSMINTVETIIDKTPTLTKYLDLINQFFVNIDSIKKNLSTQYTKADLELINNKENYNTEHAKLLTQTEIMLLEHTARICESDHNLVKYIEHSFVDLLGFSQGLISSNLTKRFQSFLNLLLLYLHYGVLRQSKEAIFIDEGQNYSINDYRILQRVSGNRTVLNIYGDTNQLVDQEIGNSSWDRLRKEFKTSYYELNENYRNTVQITKHCNKTFKYKHNAIGIDGDKVRHINANEIKSVLECALQSHSAERIAYIGKNSQTQAMMHEDVFIGDISDATGLEFDVVIFDPVNCSKNEQYIGMTRSLQQLFIVN